MNRRSAQYSGYTLAEILVVLIVIIILGSMGAFAFGGLRDSVLVKQGIEGIKQDLQLVQQKAMLIEKSSGEGWIYGIGIDFTAMSEGKYTFIKWCSPFAEYGDVMTRDELLAFDRSHKVGTNLSSGAGLNATLPTSSSDFDPSGSCSRDTTITSPSYLTHVPGMEPGKISAGYDIGLLKSNDEEAVVPSYIIFEAVTGRVFLYGKDGYPINYNQDGKFSPTRQLEILISRNRGKLADHIQVAALSGRVTHNVLDDVESINILKNRLDK
ncbi:MAG: hypothetical protein ACOX0X_02735 [Candidatus Dojkabacteria bacterium]|jgi:type II secretory pathway pseudopilin PulG